MQCFTEIQLRACCMTERHTGTNLFPTMVQSDICNVGYKDSSVFDTFAGKHCNKRGSRIVNSSGQIREPLLKSVGTIIHFATVLHSWWRQWARRPQLTWDRRLKYGFNVGYVFSDPTGIHKEVYISHWIYTTRALGEFSLHCIKELTLCFGMKWLSG